MGGLQLQEIGVELIKGGGGRENRQEREIVVH